MHIVPAIADMTLRDMVPVLDRYRPAALAAAAVLVAIIVLPGAERAGNAGPVAFEGSSSSAFGEFEDSDAGVDEVAADVPADEGADGFATDDAVAAPSFSPADESPSFSAPDSGSSSFSPSPSPSFDPSPSPSDPSTSPSPGSSFAPGPAFEPPAAGDDGDTPSPLRIVASLWASATGGTPLPSGVPEDSLPVGTRIGQTDKVSFVRLTGDAKQLVLREVEDGRRGNDFESSPVRVCQVTDPSWESGENVALSDAPEYDTDTCVDLVDGGDGTWSANLAVFPSPTGEAGLALVPAAEPPMDFQLTFATAAAAS